MTASGCVVGALRATPVDWAPSVLDVFALNLLLNDRAAQGRKLPIN